METDRLIVKDTNLGKGVFAKKNIKKGEMIIEFTGSFSPIDQVPHIEREKKDYYIQVKKNIFLGPSGYIDDYFNHSCSPNAGLLITTDKIYLTAIKNIKINEQITLDYSTTMNGDPLVINCLCGSKNCRGKITDFKYLPLDTQKKYISLGIVPHYNILEYNKLVQEKENRIFFVKNTQLETA